MVSTDRLTSFRAVVATWFATTILYCKRYSESHRGDPSWDCSGSVPIQGEFHLEDYAKLADFLPEFTGNSTATYISGCGMAHDTYEESLKNLVVEHVYSGIKRTGESEYPMDWADDVQDEADATVQALMETCSGWSCAELFAEGTAAAMLLRAELQAQALERQALVYAGQLLLKKYKLELEKPAHKGTTQWQQIRTVLVHLSEKDRRLLVPVLNVSNSIRRTLEQGSIPK
jgi:hypothetical protein